MEQTAIDRAKQLFGAEHANVQPHSGAQANMSVYLAAIQYGDQILGMNLSHGGHLTHGHPMNFSGISYKVADYGVSRETEQIDYDELQRIAEEHKPKLLVCGLLLIRASLTSNESVRLLRVSERECLLTLRTLPDQSLLTCTRLRCRMLIT